MMMILNASRIAVLHKVRAWIEGMSLPFLQAGECPIPLEGDWELVRWPPGRASPASHATASFDNGQDSSDAESSLIARPSSSAPDSSVTQGPSAAPPHGSTEKDSNNAPFLKVEMDKIFEAMERATIELCCRAQISVDVADIIPSVWGCCAMAAHYVTTAHLASDLDEDTDALTEGKAAEANREFEIIKETVCCLFKAMPGEGGIKKEILRMATWAIGEATRAASDCAQGLHANKDAAERVRRLANRMYDEHEREFYRARSYKLDGNNHWGPAIWHERVSCLELIAEMDAPYFS